MSRISHFISNSSLFIALMALSFYYFYSEILAQQFDLYQAIIIFSATLSSYISVQLYPSLLKKKKVQTKRSLWIKENQKLLTIFVFISLISIIYCSFKIKTELLIIYFHLFILTLFYENIIVSKFSLRKIPYLKPFIIAYIWSWTCVPFTSIYESIIPHIEAFCFILALSIPFDIRDMQDDLADGVITIPIKLGLKKCKALCLFIFTIYLILQASLLPQSLLVIILSAFIFIIYLFMILKTYPKQKDALFLYGFDGLILMKLLFLLAA